MDGIIVHLFTNPNRERYNEQQKWAKIYMGQNLRIIQVMKKIYLASTIYTKSALQL